MDISGNIKAQRVIVQYLDIFKARIAFSSTKRSMSYTIHLSWKMRSPIRCKSVVTPHTAERLL